MTQKKHKFNKPTSTQNARDAKEMGVLAIGSSPGWDISIDESVDAQERWYAQIEGPSVSLYFQLLDPGIVPKVIDFLERRDANPPGSRTRLNHQSSDKLIIGLFGRARVSLIWDNEYRDRCFLVIGLKSRTSIRLPFFAKDTRTLRDALRQLSEDIAPVKH